MPPVPKKGDITNRTNFRPVSDFQSVSKLFLFSSKNQYYMVDVKCTYPVTFSLHFQFKRHNFKCQTKFLCYNKKAKNKKYQYWDYNPVNYRENCENRYFSGIHKQCKTLFRGHMVRLKIISLYI